MRIFTTFRKKTIRASLVLILGLFAASIFGQTYTINVGTVTNQNPIPSSGGVIVYADSIIIPGNSTYDYVLTGTATNARRVTVKTGYHGTITFRNLTITTNASTGTAANSPYGRSGYSCITIEGRYNQTNLEPVTIVDIILEGTNTLTHTGSNYCALQVNQGAQINIRAIDPNDNTSGVLNAKTSGGAAIGAPNFYNATPGATEGYFGSRSYQYYD